MQERSVGIGLVGTFGSDVGGMGKFGVGIGW